MVRKIRILTCIFAFFGIIELIGSITSIMLFEAKLITTKQLLLWLAIFIVILVFVLMPIVFKLNYIEIKRKRQILNSKISSEFHRIWPKQPEDLLLQAIFDATDIYVKSSQEKEGFAIIKLEVNKEKIEFEMPINELTKYF